MLSANTNNASFWLGGTDEVADGDWKWVTGEAWTYAPWTGGEPNNADGGEQYLMSTFDGFWNDHPARSRHPYLLERADTTIRRAKAKAVVVNGFLVGIEILDGGFGYELPPRVTFISGTGSGAVAESVVVNGRLVEIRVRNAGCCYATIPDVIVASPPQAPTLSIEVARVRLKASVTEGRRYLFQQFSAESVWSSIGEPFEAVSETHEVEVEVVGDRRLYRVLELP